MQQTVLRAPRTSVSRSCPAAARQVPKYLRSVRSSAAPQATTPSKAMDYHLDPDNASIVVAGGGGVALNVTRRLKNMGSWVWQLQRTDVRRKEIESMMAIVAKGDAMNTDELKRVFDSIEEVDAVVSSLGGWPDVNVDSEGNINVIKAAMAKGTKKFILVTSLGCGDSKDTIGPQTYEALKKALVEKDKAEAFLQAQDQMAWTIIRPGGLTNDPATGNGVLTQDLAVAGRVSRDDVAALVAKALFSKKTDGKILSCVDKNMTRSATGQPTAEFEAFAL